ncbi:uncharacterized protein SETTUDRAFT_98039 [Exserohilum turcica Et28A]|uniref:Uncharacterized protein n=1 Tax=Exserohilum turcicum (strain 28A) TaxID=671987 RepID=R0JLQ8_EXST2|nr:uncharacterized protein SETTUDRAFT_98039 [Exserohilum turcica Et28A]EOA82153.1 hypothetical protein SETTUDRAFT_98039 [Exserohilum turcica Et28A]
MPGDTGLKKKRRGGPRSRTGMHHQTDEVNSDAPLLVDVFKLRMNDLDLSEDLPSPQSYIPANRLSPAASVGKDHPKPKVRLTSEGAFLLQTYVRTVATWMDLHEALRSEDYRKHFRGLTCLVKARRITAQSTGTDVANFWIYVRHELVVAMANEQPLIFDPAEWEVSWEEGETREDVLGNHVLWISARVINLVFGPDGNTEAGRIQRQELLHEIELWRRGLSETFVGIPYGENDEDGFRKVYFPVAAAAGAAFCTFGYHLIHILLYAEPVLQDEAYIPLIQEQAMKVADIAISEFPPSLMVFSTYGLFYAGKHIHGISRKARIWTVLNDVEAQTGYNTTATVRLLQ